MKQLHIEWKHYEKEGQSCERCSATGKTLYEVIQGLRQELGERNVHIDFTETALPESSISESNTILINGHTLEEILHYTPSSSNCPSCSCLTGKETTCKTLVHDDATYEEIPEELIRTAVFQVLDNNQT